MPDEFDDYGIEAQPYRSIHINPENDIFEISAMPTSPLPAITHQVSRGRQTVPTNPYRRKQQRFSRKRIVTILIILVLLLGSAGGFFVYLTRSTPNKTLATFCSGLQQSDYHSSYEQFSARLQHTFSERDFASTLAHDKISSCTYTTTAEPETSVRTTLTIRHTSKKLNTDQVTLIKDETHSWKINDVQAVRNQRVLQEAETHHLDLAAQQQLRDPAAVFSAATHGADTGIAVIHGERIVMFLSGTANVSAKAGSSGPDGESHCASSTLPEPGINCYSVIYSLGLTSRAREVGSHADFTVPADGTLFLGVNIPEQMQATGSFQVTLLTIPSGTVTGLWQAPNNGFFTQVQKVALQVQVFAQNDPVSSVSFFLVNDQGLRSTICTTTYAGTGTVSCDWDLTTSGINGQRGTPIANGPVSIAFSISASVTGATSVNDVRTGIVRYVASEESYNYSGYGAQSFDQTVHYQSATMSWKVPQVACTPGENSDVGIWAGLTGNPDASQLAQTGTLSACVNGTPAYAPWWEMYPAPTHLIDRLVEAGDMMTARVLYKNGIFQLILSDESKGWQYSTTQNGTDRDTITGLCIVEAPFDPVKNQIVRLSNFGSVAASCQVNDQPIGVTGPQNIVYQLNGPQQHALTSELNQEGNSFTVQWQSN